MRIQVVSEIILITRFCKETRRRRLVLYVDPQTKEKQKVSKRVFRHGLGTKNLALLMTPIDFEILRAT